MNALKSLLEKNNEQEADDTAILKSSKSSSKSKQKKKKGKSTGTQNLLQKKRPKKSSDDLDEETTTFNSSAQDQDDIIFIDKHEYNKNVDHKRKLFDWLKKPSNNFTANKKHKKFNNQTEEFNGTSSSGGFSNSTSPNAKKYYLNLERDNLNKIANAGISPASVIKKSNNYDNYNLEDMDIEPSPSSNFYNNTNNTGFSNFPNNNNNVNINSFSGSNSNLAQMASFLIQSNNFYQNKFNQNSYYENNSNNLYNNVNPSSAIPSTSSNLFSQNNYYQNNYNNQPNISSSATNNNSNFMNEYQNVLMSFIQHALMQPNQSKTQQPQPLVNANPSSYLSKSNFSSSQFDFSNNNNNNVNNNANRSRNNSQKFNQNTKNRNNESFISFNSNSTFNNNSILNNSTKKTHDLTNEKENTENITSSSNSKVIFTLSSPSTNKSSNNSSKSISPSNEAKQTNILDLDERFIDQTSGKLDIDYRQNSSNENQNFKQFFQSILTVFNDKIEKLNTELSKGNLSTAKQNEEDVNTTVKKDSSNDEIEGEEQKEEEKEEEKEEDENEMIQLRMKLLDQKNQIKKQKEEHERQMRLKLIERENEKKKKEEQQSEERKKRKEIEENQMNQDLEVFKRKLEQQEQEFIKNSKTIESSNDKQKQINAFKPKQISPVIIRINPNDSTSDEEDNAENQDCPRSSTSKLNGDLAETFEHSLNAFLNQAKQMVVKNIYDNKNESRPTQQISKQSEQKATSTEEIDKKELIKSLRDRINMKSKAIVEFTTKSNELSQIKTKKEKDMELIKTKITMLREQLQAAEKVFHSNQESLSQIDNQKRLIDLKLVKLQNIKKTQQQLLQKILSSPSISSTSNPNINNKLTEPKQVVSFQPPLPKEPPPPLPPHPPSNPQPSPPPLPQLNQDDEKSVSPPTSKSHIVSNLTLGSEVAATVSLSNKPSTTSDLNTANNQVISRPNLYTSESTNLELEKLAKQEYLNNNENTSNNNSIVIDAKVVKIAPKTKSNPKLKQENECKKVDLEDRFKLIDCLSQLNIDYPYIHAESFDIWCNESILQEQQQSIFEFKNSHKLDEELELYRRQTDAPYLSSNSLATTQNSIYIIGNVREYESPLKMFRGYRFSSNYSHLNQFDDAYSKFYCNTIDFRRPFCPYDLHGSCKDSNCMYQHSNAMTMDNIQRTEHFLSYAPKLLGLSSQNPTQKEAIKKLKLYAKTFMTNNLNRMSIKDYFKFLYDHVIANLESEQQGEHSIILSRIPALCLSNNKSIGVCDNHHQDDTDVDMEVEDEIVIFLDKILSVNMNRSLEIKLKYLLSNGVLDINWLKGEDQSSNNGKVNLNKNEIIIGWIYFSKHVYLSNSSLSSVDQIEKLLNVLSHALEANSKCELIWLVYLKTYLIKRNSSNDYHEICLLCLDNLITYDLVWFMLNTCKSCYSDLIFERVEKYLIHECLNDLNEFEQQFENNLNSNENLTINERISFYIFELIIFNVHLKLNFDSSENSDSGKLLLKKYLDQIDVTNKLEPNDLCLLWLCLIHLEAFKFLPNWLRINTLLTSRVYQDFYSNSFWLFDANKSRNYNRNFFMQVKLIYTSRLSGLNNLKRKLDLFLIPWNIKQSSNQANNQQQAQKTLQRHNQTYICSKEIIDKVQTLFYDALKAINTRCVTSNYNKQYIRMVSLPLFINLMYLEVSNKRFDTAVKLCERLVKSADANMFKELWLTFVYIKHAQIQHSNSSSITTNSESNISEKSKLAEQTNDIEMALINMIEKFPNDAQVRYIAAKYYASIVS